jgi:ATP-dependent DNA ligase
VGGNWEREAIDHQGDVQAIADPMKLPIKPPYPPMEARAVAEPPRGEQWQYEPKWDGFRCLAFRDGSEIYLQSKSGQPLARYFPDVVESLRELRAEQFVLDGEILVPLKGRASFDQLLQRIHPAASRVKKLASEYPAVFVVFDLLVTEKGKLVAEMPLASRRKELERFGTRFFRNKEEVMLSPVTTDLKRAQKWFSSDNSGLDGIVAKRRDLVYLSGSRDGMQKIKHHQTADCVVGGFRYSEGKKTVGSLLLGLYDEQGLLNHVGFSSSFSAKDRADLLKMLKPLMGGPGFTGSAPGGPSRWSTRRSSEWEPLQPKLVIEVEYDNFTGKRFRHGTRFLRFRPDKRPGDCMYEQLAMGGGAKLKLLRA